MRRGSKQPLKLDGQDEALMARVAALVDDMLAVADVGDRSATSLSRLALFGIIRDSAHRIRVLLEEEQEARTDAAGSPEGGQP